MIAVLRIDEESRCKYLPHVRQRFSGEQQSPALPELPEEGNPLQSYPRENAAESPLLSEN
jgi:hypothetical protein